MAAPAAVVAARVAVLLLDDLLLWGLLAAAVAVILLLLPILLPILGFGAILALFSGLSGTSQGGGPVWGGNPMTVAVEPDPRGPAGAHAAGRQLGAVCSALDNPGGDRRCRVDFGKTADQFSSAGAYGYGQFLEGTWQSYGGGIPWQTSDPQERAKPLIERRDSTNFHYALPAMARYLCAEGAGTDLRAALFAYNHADWYVAEIVQIAARYDGIGASGGGLIDGWADRPPLNQYDRRNYRSDQSWLTWRDADCSAAALDWLLGAYGRTIVEDAIALVGPGKGISTSLGLLDERGPALAQALVKEGLHARRPDQKPLGSIAELKAWLDQGPLLMDGARCLARAAGSSPWATTRTASTPATRATGIRAT